jgi:hypothetical protein
MTTNQKVFAVSLLVYLSPMVSAAQKADVPGSKDHSLVSRYPGSVITEYTAKEYDEFLLPLGTWSPLWNGAAQRLRAAREVFIHGYSMPASDLPARELLFGNINSDATINVHCRSNSGRIADEFHRRGFAWVEAFPEIEFEAWVA